MRAMRFRTTSKGGLPHLSYIFHNLEPLREEFKAVVCSVIGSLIFLEIQWEKEGMKLIWYSLELGYTAAYTKRFIEETKGVGQRALKVSTRGFSCSAFGSCRRKQQRQPPPLVLI